MKILQVVHNFLPYSYAGTEIYTCNLSKELSRRHKVFIFHRIRNEDKKDYELRQYRFNNLEVFLINNTCRSYNSFEDTYNNKRIEEKFVQVLDIIKPDIVHIQHLLFLSMSIIQRIKQRNIPIVFTLHDYWLICPQGQFLKNSLTACNNPTDNDCVKCMISQLSLKERILDTYYKLRNRLPSLMLQLLKKSYINYAKKAFLSEQEAINKIIRRKAFIEQLFKDVDLFIAPSRFLLNKFLEYKLPANKIIFSRDGIDTGRFRDFGRKKSNRMRIGFIGTIHPAKGPHILIEAFNKIKGNNAELKIYGKVVAYSGLEHYPRLLKRISKNKNIHFMGGFKNFQVAEIFSEMDILAFPSIWSENCPLTILEAFSTKTPVIASRIGGLPELVKNNENGLLFESRNTYDLYDKMETFINNSDLIERLRDRINPPKSIEENGQEIEELYNGLLNDNRF